MFIGIKLIPRDINSPQNGKLHLVNFDERTLTEWMKDNLLLFIYANNDYANVEKRIDSHYNPPLNLQGKISKKQSLISVRSFASFMHSRRNKPQYQITN